VQRILHLFYSDSDTGLINYCLKIHCQETDSGDCTRVRKVVGVTVNSKI
jgi:hypothetical protein